MGEKWEADHIVAVINGGGGCGIEGYQTLCIPCHKEKTQRDLEQYRNNLSHEQEQTEDRL